MILLLSALTKVKLFLIISQKTLELTDMYQNQGYCRSVYPDLKDGQTAIQFMNGAFGNTNSFQLALIIARKVVPDFFSSFLVINAYHHPNPDFSSAIDVQSAQSASVQRWVTGAATSCGVASIYGSPEGMDIPHFSDCNASSISNLLCPHFR